MQLTNLRSKAGHGSTQPVIYLCEAADEIHLSDLGLP